VTETPDPPGGEKLGSAAEEAAKLAAALQDFARRTTGEHIATGSAECRLCPLCQLISLLRDTNPAVVEHLVAAAESLMSALRAGLQGQHGDARTRQHRDQQRDQRRDRSGVQHIDIGE
jgi:hypothetical protein